MSPWREFNRFGWMRCWRVAVACCFLLAVSLEGISGVAVESGRFRYGAISWRRVGGATSRRVIITVESAWRLSHESIVVFGTRDRISQPGQVFKVVASEVEDPLLQFGDTDITARYDVTVLRVEPLLDTVVGVTEFLHDYPSLGTYTAILTLCCRVAGTQNSLRSMNLQTLVNLGSGVLGSPVFSMMPTVFLDATQRGLQTFRVPAVSNGGGSLSFSLGSAAQYGYRSVPPSSAIVRSIDASAGIVTVNVTCWAVGNCPLTDQNVVVQVGNANSFTTVDFIVKMQGPVAGTGNIPSLALLPAVPNDLVTAYVGFQVNLQFQGADSDTAQNVFFQYNTLPAGASLGDLQGANPALQQVSWTPFQNQTGRSFVCARSTDVNPFTPCTPCTPGIVDCIPDCVAFRSSGMRCVEIVVMANPPPLFVEPVNLNRRVYMNQEIQILVRATTPNPSDVVTMSVHNVHPEGSSVVSVGGNTDRLLFVWKPTHKFGGWASDVCFRASNQPAPGRTVSQTIQCISIQVVKCMWQVGPGQSLDSIANMFGTNYVQLWALNSEKDTPDAVLQQGDVVRIGHLYQVRSADNIRYLSVQFATTRATLELLNFNTIDAGITEKTPLADLAGTEMCILPHSCYGAVAVDA